jgi:hypothetical protein
MNRIIVTVMILVVSSLGAGLQAQGTATISGFAYNDLNKNMVRDSGEQGLFSTTVVVGGDSTFTDLDGFYEFIVSAPDTYTVIERQGPQTESTTPDTVTVAVEPDSGYTVDFGDYAPPPATIYGYVFEDSDGSGAWEPGESVIHDVMVSVNGDTTTTDTEGLYSFLVEAPDTYTVIETDPPLHFSITPNEITVIVEPGDSYRVDFGDSLVPTAVIYGTVFADSNVNGFMDPGEPGIPDVAVKVNGDSTKTDFNGHYSFTVAAPGTYVVREVTPPGYISTSPDSIEITCEPNWSWEINFGEVEPIPVAVILGTVFEDLNRDGMHDTNEVGVAGSVVEVSLPGENVSITTDTTGAYAFALAPGTYEVFETNAPGYWSTTTDTFTVDLTSGEVYQADFGDRMIVEVPVDIKPGACPNRVNSKSKNFLLVAIAGTGTGEFEAAEIDPGTVCLEGIAPLTYSLKDIAGPHEPFLGKEGCHDCTKSRSDGILDFEMKFDLEEIRQAIGTVTTDSCLVLHLSGNFSDGFPFVGEDVLLLRIVGKPVAMNSLVPGRYHLSAQPNPFSGAATIGFALPEPGTVRVTVHDVLGRDVAVIAEGLYGAGLHAEGWDGQNGAGEEVTPGIYFVRIEAGQFKATSKIIVLK